MLAVASRWGDRSVCGTEKRAETNQYVIALSEGTALYSGTHLSGLSDNWTDFKAYFCLSQGDKF